MFVDNSLLDLYYQHFHPSHPFVLPRAALQIKLAEGTSSIQSLVMVMQYLGSFYGEFTRVTDIPDVNTTSAPDGFSVQTDLLRALASSMCSLQPAAQVFLNKAIEQAKFIGMHTKAFAEMAQFTEPVVAESWKRTWWMLYLIDANFAVMRRDYVPLITPADYDVDLPCEEWDYSAMNIPRESRTLTEYQTRECALESKNFSSFSYLIDASQIFVSSLQKSTQYESIGAAERLCDDLETIAIGWLVMLPPNKRSLKPILLDQLMFQGHMMIYTVLAYIHRPLSSLQYHPAEGISTCGSPPPPIISDAHSNCAVDHLMHTEKLLQAVRKQNQCLTLLPLGVAQLSPFLICMVACCTIAHIVASKSSFQLHEAEVTRSRIRVCIGTLMYYEDIWPRAKKILLELRSVAHLILQAEVVGQSIQASFELTTEQNTAFAMFGTESSHILQDSSREFR